MSKGKGFPISSNRHTSMCQATGDAVVVGLACDIVDRAALRAAFAEAVGAMGRGGGIDICVANAYFTERPGGQFNRFTFLGPFF